MKKLFTFLGLVIALCLVQTTTAQTYFKNFLVDEDFETVGMEPWSFSGNFSTGIVINQAPIQSEIYGKSLLVSRSGNANNLYGEYNFGELAFNDDKRLWVDFDWFVGPDNNLYSTGNGIFIFLKDDAGKIILGLNVGKAKGAGNNNIHLLNLDKTIALNVDSIVCAPDTATILDSDAESTLLIPEGGIFDRQQQWLNVHAVFNFETGKIDSLKITSNETITYENNGLDFYDAEASGLSKFALRFYAVKATNQKYVAPGFDNFRIYRYDSSQGTENITVKYQDMDGNEARPDKVIEDYQVGIDYTIDIEDKNSFILNGNYYVYNPFESEESLTTTAGVENVLILKYYKAQATSGVYKWKGYSEFWNEIEGNFTTDGSNQIGYQFGNAVEFGNEQTFFKDILVNKDVELGDQNVTISADGYTFSGTGKLKGTGKVIVNASTTIGFINDMTDAVVDLNDGNLEVIGAQAAKKINVNNNASTLKLKASAYAADVNVAGETLNLENFSTTNALNITGENLKTVNFIINETGKLSSSTWTNNWNNTKIPAGVQVNANASPGLDTIATFATRYDAFANCKLNLGDSIKLMYYYNQDASKGTTFTIGELTGSAGSYISGGFVGSRTLIYKVGSLNTDAVFNGKIRDYTAGSTLNIIKEGTGSWTLTGNSVYGSIGSSITASEGKLIIDGIIGSPETMIGDVKIEAATYEDIFAEVGEGEENPEPEVIGQKTVKQTGILSGTGTIYANTTDVLGTLTGSLTFGGSLQLQPGSTTIINVNGNTVDKHVVLGDVYFGGKLIVNVIQEPTGPADFVVFEYDQGIESGDNGFEEFELPEDWSFDFNKDWENKSILTYSGEGYNSVPVLQDNKVIVSTEYYNLTGMKISKNTNGIKIMKVIYDDGTSKAVKVIDTNRY